MTAVAIAIGAGVVSVIVIIVGIISIRSDSDMLDDRLNSADGLTPAIDMSELENEKEQKLTLRERFNKASEGLEESVGDREFAQKWRQQLARADLKLTVPEYAVLHIVSMAVVFALTFFIIATGNLVVAIMGGFVGLFLPRIYVARQVSTRLIRFEEQLPDTLGLWVNALRSGYSVLQAMEAISKDAPQPTSTEFRRVVTEVQLGIRVEDALEHLLERVESPDLDLVVTAVNIQREVGGNLAEILEVIQHTIRERVKLKGEIRVLTSQGRMTGYIISFLPIILSVFLSFVSPGFMNPLFTNRMCGWPMIGIGLALIGLGTAAIQKIIDIEI